MRTTAALVLACLAGLLVWALCHGPPRAATPSRPCRPCPPHTKPCPPDPRPCPPNRPCPREEGAGRRPGPEDGTRLRDLPGKMEKHIWSVGLRDGLLVGVPTGFIAALALVWWRKSP